MLGRPAGHFPEHVAFMESYRGHLVDPWPPWVGRDDCQVGKVSGKFVNGRRVGVPDFCTEPAWHTGAHAGRADVDHHRRPQFVDDLEQRIELAISNRKMSHDRMEV